MKNIQDSIEELIIHYVVTDPLGKLPKMLNLAEKIDQGHLHENEINGIRKILDDKNGNWYKFIEGISEDIDPKCLQKVVECFMINASLKGEAKARAVEKKYDMNVPWTILVDPTSACNLHCTGCWAAEYGNKNNLSYETLDSLVNQGVDLGIYFYIFSGGEPLIRKDDIIRLCKAHQDCYFFSFTNGTLVDDQFCKQIGRAHV